MQPIYIVMTKNRYIIGAYLSMGDATNIVDKYRGNGKGVHLVETVLYPESWRSDDSV